MLDNGNRCRVYFQTEMERVKSEILMNDENWKKSVPSCKKGRKSKKFQMEVLIILSAIVPASTNSRMAVSWSRKRPAKELKFNKTLGPGDWFMFQHSHFLSDDEAQILKMLEKLVLLEMIRPFAVRER